MPQAPLTPPPVSLQAGASLSVQATPMSDDGGAPPTLEQIVRVAFDRNFSDVHLGVGELPRFRDRGDMILVGLGVTDASTFRDWLLEIMPPPQIDRFVQQKEYDGSCTFGFVRVRINLLESMQGPAMVLRLIPQCIPTIDELNLPPVLKDLAQRPKGMLLVTGPTGSGKSSTLAAVIDHINRTMKRHIVTIEDPVEFVHESRQSLIRQRELGRHTRHFKTALRAALREDPDVILVGEIRDRDTLATAIEASQTGHLLLGTLHTNSAVHSVERILEMYPPVEQENIRRSVANALLGLISQGLIKTVDGTRISYHDVFINTDACKDYIMRGNYEEIESIMARSGFDGMITSNQYLANLVSSGRVHLEEALAVSSRPSELAQTIRGRT